MCHKNVYTIKINQTHSHHSTKCTGVPAEQMIKNRPGSINNFLLFPKGRALSAVEITS